MKYRQIIQYFQNLQTLHPDLVYFAFGDYDRILGAERDRISYPCLWLEVPTAKFVGDTDSKKKVWDVSFVVLINSPVDDVTRIEANIDQAEQICLDIISKILFDSTSGTFLSANLGGAQMDIVYSRNNDNDQGWRVELDLEVKANIACDQSIWNP